MEESNPELESFRQRWREEVQARTKGKNARSSLQNASQPGQSQRRDVSASSKTSAPATSLRTDDEHDPDVQIVHDFSGTTDQIHAGPRSGDPSFSKGRALLEPISALEHYEKGVEKERQGNLGDSLNYYRKAYRLDAGVDQIYRNKYFPTTGGVSKPSNPNPSNAPVTVPNTAHHSLSASTTALIETFAHLSIPAALPLIENSPAPPSPLSTIPREILEEILLYVAIKDVACFVRLAQVCKSLAYLVATDDRVWKRVCEGPEVGFGGMHYTWSCDLFGAPLSRSIQQSPDRAATPPIYRPLTPLPPHLTYMLTFRHRPRVRFAGIYISTVNYIRPGASAPTQTSWTAPVHIVTYYRYLRFFRDGTVFMLTTTTEPSDVVHNFTREVVLQNSPSFTAVTATTSTNLTGAAAVKGTLRGRWRLSGGTRTDGGPYGLLLSPRASSPVPPSSLPPSRSAIAPGSTTQSAGADADASAGIHDREVDQEEGSIRIETSDGPRAKYAFTSLLTLRSAGRNGPRNNKLVWKGLWSYNRLTDDWAQFSLRNDKPFFWSRVRSYDNA
ncbi:MAG: hypothetical protein M1838_005843 [Thelocarpon superellum]|nr:MAG: hypothetical protein M1838_005843 [Thelocarpon superellum]